MWTSFFSSPWLGSAGWPFGPSRRRRRAIAPWDRAKWGWVVAAGVFVVANLGIFYVDKRTPWTLLLRRGEQIRSTVAVLADLPGHFARLDASLRESAARMALPRTRALAEGGPVGYHGMYPAALVSNGLRYAPSPATISFAAWNAYSMAKDRAFLADDARAPATLLYDATTVDSRLAAQDDALAQLEILHRYELVDGEYGNLLLRRVPGRGGLIFARLGEEAHALGEWIAVPDTAEPVWVRLWLGEPLLGRLVATLYKPPRYMIELAFADGTSKTYKFMPRMAQVGFLLNPLIEDNYGAVLARLAPASGQGPARVTRFRILCDRFEALAADSLRLEWEAVQGLDLTPGREPGRFERVMARLYAFDAVFDAGHPAPRLAKSIFEGDAFYRLPVPGEWSLAKRAGPMRLSFAWGMPPGAYEHLDPSDGVALTVRYAPESGPARLVYDREIDPAGDPADRGVLSVAVDLPESPGELTILVGPRADARKDALLVRGLALTPLVR